MAGPLAQPGRVQRGAAAVRARGVTSNRVACLLAAALLPLTACTAPAAGSRELHADLGLRVVLPAEAAALPDVVAGTRRLGTELLAGAPPEGNVVTSPSSLAVALAMLAEGARGPSLADLEEVLGASGEGRRDAFAALRGALNRLDGDPAVVRGADLPEQPLVHLADQVVVDDGYEVSSAYLAALADGFGAGVQTADLSTEEGKRVLSAWIDHHTGGLIRETAIQPSADLRVVLQDAILLAARWEVPFAAAATSPRPFTLPDGGVVQTDTMAGAVLVAHAERDGWRAVRLPYRGGTLHADLVLPPAGTDPATASPELLAGLDAALAAATPELVELTLPTVDVKARTLDLLDTLRAAGAGSVLCDSPATDLTGVGPEGLCVGQAMQQAVLAIDEEGTVAAAVTEIGMEATSAQEPQLRLDLDRPFLVQIGHTETGWPLFLAAIRDPRH